MIPCVLVVSGGAVIERMSTIRDGVDARRLVALGFRLTATSGTALYLSEQGICVDVVNKVQEGRPHIVDHIKNGEVALVVNTVRTASAPVSAKSQRSTALVSA